MAFIQFGNQFISFATTEDLRALDARLFEQNEGLDDNYLQDQLQRSTEHVTQVRQPYRSTLWLMCRP
jgi:hypothetical protein